MNFLSKLIPTAIRSGSRWRSLEQVCRHFLFDYGWWKTVSGAGCVRADGSPIPWFTYPAIDYLDGLDLTGKRVFEWGSGFSTMYWLSRGALVTSVESDPIWYERVKKSLSGEAELILCTDGVTGYCEIIERYGKFDIILIDGLGEARLDGCLRAPSHLSSGGMIILDNSDSWRDATKPLREADLIQVDFTGFAPMNCHAGCTSIFMSRSFSFLPHPEGQPKLSVAQPAKPWENLYDPKSSNL